MPLTPEEIEAAARAEEEARKQQDPAAAGSWDLTGLDVLSTAGDLALSAAQGVGEVAAGAVEVVGGVLGAIGSVFDGL